MFESLTHLQLQQLWWIIISLLAGIFVFILFIQGGQSLIFSLPKNELEKTMLINALGRKWELGFTTLVLFGGACFAAFPLFYAVSFGGAYWVWLAILFCFIIQAVSYEYRKKPNNFLGQKGYEIFLFVNGIFGVFLLGAALSTLFSGAKFSLDANRFVTWHTELRGLEALLNPANYLLGLAMIFLTRIQASLYIISIIDDSAMKERSYALIKRELFIFLAFFLAFLGWLLFKDGFVYDSITKVVSVNNHHYAKSLLNMPFVAFMLICGVILVLIGAFGAIFSHMKRSVWLVGIGTILTVMAIFLLAGLNNSLFYPSLVDMQYSLSIENASGSHFTLTAMSYIALFIPFVLAYIIYAWRCMDKVKITKEEMSDPHSHNY